MGLLDTVAKLIPPCCPVLLPITVLEIQAVELGNDEKPIVLVSEAYTTAKVMFIYARDTLYTPYALYTHYMHTIYILYTYYIHTIYIIYILYTYYIHIMHAIG